MITFSCPRCDRRLVAEDRERGGPYRCINCGQTMTVPSDPFLPPDVSAKELAVWSEFILALLLPPYGLLRAWLLSQRGGRRRAGATHALAGAAIGVIAYLTPLLIGL